MIEIKHGTDTFKFKEPSKRCYSLVTDEINKQDYFEAVRILITNCYIKDENGIDLENDPQTQVQLSNEIIDKLFTFYKVEIDTKYSGKQYNDLYKKLTIEYGYVYAVIISDASLTKPFITFYKPLKLDDYKTLFNLSVKGTSLALDHIISDLKVGGDDIFRVDKAYASCMGLTDYMLNYKSDDIKKK